MPTPTVITDLSQTASANYPAGSDSPSVLDDVQRAHAAFIALLRDSKGLTAAKTLASGSTTDVGGENSYAVEITGTTTITSFGTNYSGPRYLRFTGILTLTHNATLLNLPGAANITTAEGDTAIATPNATGNGWNVTVFNRASGLPLVSPTDYLNTTRIDVASASTVDLTAGAPATRHINITGTTSITAFTVAIGQVYFVRFNAALTLTNGASLVTQTGANIITAAGDTCIIRSTAANTVEVMAYSPAVVNFFPRTTSSYGSDTVTALSTGVGASFKVRINATESVEAWVGGNGSQYGHGTQTFVGSVAGSSCTVDIYVSSTAYLSRTLTFPEVGTYLVTVTGTVSHYASNYANSIAATAIRTA